MLLQWVGLWSNKNAYIIGIIQFSINSSHFTSTNFHRGLPLFVTLIRGNDLRWSTCISAFLFILLTRKHIDSFIQFFYCVILLYCIFNGWYHNFVRSWFLGISWCCAATILEVLWLRDTQTHINLEYKI